MVRTEDWINYTRKGMTRRQALALLPAAMATVPRQALGQRGMASRNVKPVPMGKPSGKPFDARFTNVAQAAGLRSPVIYGAGGQADYILEVMGCGAAFLDYDNDGWLDILLLTGSPLRCRARRRLQPALQEQSRRHVYRCHREGGTDPHRSGLRRHRRRLRQRRLRRPLRHLLGPERPLPQQRRRHLHGCHRTRPACSTGRPLRRRLHLGRLRPRRPARPVRLQLPRLRPDNDPARRTDRRLQLPRRARQLRPARPAARQPCRLYRNNGDGTFTDVSGKSGIAQVQPAAIGLTVVAADFDNDGWPDIYVACDSTPSLLLPQQPRRHLHRGGPGARRRAQRGRAWSRPAWASASATSTCDGNLDIFKTHFADDTPVLYRNDGKGNFPRRDRSAPDWASRRASSAGARASSTSITTALPDLFCGHRQCLSRGGEARSRMRPTRRRASSSATSASGKFEELIERGRTRRRRGRTPAAAAPSATSTTTATSIS